VENGNRAGTREHDREAVGGHGEDGQAGLAGLDAGQVAQADLDEFKPPRDPAP
jgi:hypothetical protein